MAGARLERDGPLREQVLAGLGAGWSPAQVAGRLALDEGRQIISPESIYRFIYAQMARKKDYSWRHYLPRAKAKRGFRGRRGGSPATHITLRVPLSQRPHAAADRATFGHWEGDLMHFGNHGPALLALAERHSRLVLLARLPGKGADVTADTIARLLAPLPPEWRQTITFDNGTEFARHYRLHPLGIQTFFCDTRSPWQKGGVENTIGRLRRPLPRKTRLADLSEAAFTQIIQLYNNTPRKCLGYRTPAETLDDQVLHLKCELTFPPARERRVGWREQEGLGCVRRRCGDIRLEEAVQEGMGMRPRVGALEARRRDELARVGDLDGLVPRPRRQRRDGGKLHLAAEAVEVALQPVVALGRHVGRDVDEELAGAFHLVEVLTAVAAHALAARFPVESGAPGVESHVASLLSRLYRFYRLADARSRTRRRR